MEKFSTVGNQHWICIYNNDSPRYWKMPTQTSYRPDQTTTNGYFELIFPQYKEGITQDF